MAVVWRDNADLHVVRRAADVLRANRAAHGLPLTASLVDSGPAAEPVCPATPDPSERRGTRVTITAEARQSLGDQRALDALLRVALHEIEGVAPTHAVRFDLFLSVREEKDRP